MTDEVHTHTIDLKAGLRVWAKMHGVTPTKFSDEMGYRYAHAQGLLNGDRAVTFEMIGRFLQTYGAKNTSELLALSGLPVTATMLPINAPADADPQAERPMLLRGVRMPDPGRAIDSTAPQVA